MKFSLYTFTVVKKIAFHGAAGEVTGSAYVVTAEDNTELLVDFGMFQGPEPVAKLNYRSLPFNPSSIKGVLVTHAHLDHCGRLPLLVFGNYFGKIYMTEPTLALVDVILNDAAKIAEENMEYEPLYSLLEVDKVLQMIEVVQYNKPFQIGGFEVNFKDAGHILGSASIEITDTTDRKKAVFSGDLGNFPEDIVRHTEFFDQANYVVMESTYGDRTRPKEDPTQILLEEINMVEKTGGVLLIPAFSVERTQEILHRIHHLKKDGKVRAHTPVFMDSPMGIRATQVFKGFKEFYNTELQTHIEDPFGFEGLVVTETPRDSKDIRRSMPPKVIIAGSGMLSGGRILHHAANYLPDPTTRLLFVGYQAEETLGRKILEGSKKVQINRQSVRVNAKIREIASLSSHADQPKLLEWLGKIKEVERVFLTHGEQSQREAFAEKIKTELGIRSVTLPMNGEEHALV